MKPFDKDIFVLIPTGITETGDIVYRKCRSPGLMQKSSRWGDEVYANYAEIPNKNEGLVVMQQYESPTVS